MSRHWWLTPDGNWFECEGSGFMECAFVQPGYFGLTEVDRRFMLSTANKDRGQQIHAFMDKVMQAGGILAEWVDEPKRFIIAFWVEDHPVYLRVMKWLLALHASPKQQILLKEWSSQRQWITSAQQILSGGQFSKNPDRDVTCNRCGADVRKLEVVERGVCPACGQDLVGPM